VEGMGRGRRDMQRDATARRPVAIRPGESEQIFSFIVLVATGGRRLNAPRRRVIVTGHHPRHARLFTAVITCTNARPS